MEGGKGHKGKKWRGEGGEYQWKENQKELLPIHYCVPRGNFSFPLNLCRYFCLHPLIVRSGHSPLPRYP